MRKPLQKLSDGAHLGRLGKAARETLRAPAGDDTDRGLILLRLLNEQGYDVVPRYDTRPVGPLERQPWED